MDHRKPLLPTSSDAAPNPHTRKDLLLVICGLLLLSSLVAFGGYRASNAPHADVSSPASNDEQPSPTSVPSPKWYPVSRGVSSGVSEKSSSMFFAVKDGASEAFPWDNSMLSWQRTAFHFQPEKNWMNGNFFFHLLPNDDKLFTTFIMLLALSPRLKNMITYHLEIIKIT